MTTRPTSTFDCDHQPKESQPDNIQTTEQRLADVRKTMRYYKPYQTFGREHGRIEGYYYTEPVDSLRVERLTDGIVLKTRRG